MKILTVNSAALFKSLIVQTSDIVSKKIETLTTIDHVVDDLRHDVLRLRINSLNTKDAIKSIDWFLYGGKFDV